MQFHSIKKAAMEVAEEKKWLNDIKTRFLGYNQRLITEVEKVTDKFWTENYNLTPYGHLT